MRVRLLLAEDERSLSRAIAAILKRNRYEVDAVCDGMDALAYLENGGYDAAILDIMMPGLDGLSVLRRLRAGGDATPVLLLTAKSEVEDKVLGLDSGANDYLTKPFAVPELLARLRAMTRGRAAGPAPQLRLGNISLDRATHELSSPVGSYRLASKEFQMMEMLLQNPGRMIPAERFMEKIWGYDANAQVHVVWVYVSYLRRKLERLQADVHIRVVRGVGYTMEAIA